MIICDSNLTGAVKLPYTKIQPQKYSVPHKVQMYQLLTVHNHTYMYVLMSNISLSTIVLNSRDWSEIIWLPKISRFEINLAIGFIQKNPLEYIG